MKFRTYKNTGLTVGEVGFGIEKMGSRLEIFDISRAASARVISIVRNDLVPLVGRRACDEGDDRFGVAHVEDFMRYTGLDVNEIARLILNHLLAAGAEFVADFSFYDVKDHFEIDMNMGVRNAAGRDGGDVRGQTRRPHVFARHALLVMNPVPVPTRTPAADGQYPAMIFHRAKLQI